MQSVYVAQYSNIDCVQLVYMSQYPKSILHLIQHYQKCGQRSYEAYCSLNKIDCLSTVFSCEPQLNKRVSLSVSLLVHLSVGWLVMLLSWRAETIQRTIILRI